MTRPLVFTANICPNCHISIMRNDAWLYRGWVKCYSCGYMEELEVED